MGNHLTVCRERFFRENSQFAFVKQDQRILSALWINLSFCGLNSQNCLLTARAWFVSLSSTKHFNISRSKKAQKSIYPHAAHDRESAINFDLLWFQNNILFVASQIIHYLTLFTLQNSSTPPQVKLMSPIIVSSVPSPTIPLPPPLTFNGSMKHKKLKQSAIVAPVTGVVQVPPLISRGFGQNSEYRCAFSSLTKGSINGEW